MPGPIDLASLQRSEYPVIRSNRSPGISEDKESSGKSEGIDFADAMAEAITSASSDDRTAASMEKSFADGDPNVGIHEVVIASEKANLSLKYTVTLKNRLLEAYRDIMSTQV